MNGRIVSPVVVLLFVSATRTFAGGAGQAAQAPPPAVGMFRGATPIEGRVFDARMAIRTLRYAMLGGRAIIEGDIDLGTPDTRARSSLAMASRFARQVMGGGAIFDRLGPGDRRSSRNSRSSRWTASRSGMPMSATTGSIRPSISSNGSSR